MTDYPGNSWRQALLRRRAYSERNLGGAHLVPKAPFHSNSERNKSISWDTESGRTSLHHWRKPWIKSKQQAPKTKREVRVFFGLTSYYREFILNYAEISAPLTELTRKGENNIVQYTATHEDAFEQLKQCISSLLVLRLPDLSQNVCTAHRRFRDQPRRRTHANS